MNVNVFIQFEILKIQCEIGEQSSNRKQTFRVVYLKLNEEIEDEEKVNLTPEYVTKLKMPLCMTTAISENFCFSHCYCYYSVIRQSHYTFSV